MESQQSSFSFIIDEAIALLREIPKPVLSLYFAGSVPFVLGALYFWSEMSRSSFAASYASSASFILALLFIWMKFWHALFCIQLRAFTARETVIWAPSRLWNLFLVQTAIQPSRLVVLPVAILLLIPFGWIYAFYENVSVVGDGRGLQINPVLQHAWKLSLLWPKTNHLLIWVLSPFMLVSAIVFALGMGYLLPIVSPHMTSLPDQVLLILAIVFLILILPLSPLGVLLFFNLAASLYALPIFFAYSFRN